MAKVVLILELVCAIIQQEANKCFFDNKEKVHQKLRQQFSNVLNHGYAKANPNLNILQHIRKLKARKI